MRSVLLISFLSVDLDLLIITDQLKHVAMEVISENLFW